MDELFAGYAGVYGDRLFAFKSSASRPGFPWFTAREQRQMLRYQPRFRNPEKAARPINWAEAEKLPPGANPVSASPSELMIDVETPSGEAIAIDDPALIEMLRAGRNENHELTLLRSDRTTPSFAATIRRADDHREVVAGVCNRRQHTLAPWSNISGRPSFPNHAGFRVGRNPGAGVSKNFGRARDRYRVGPV